MEYSLPKDSLISSGLQARWALQPEKTSLPPSEIRFRSSVCSVISLQLIFFV